MVNEETIVGYFQTPRRDMVLNKMVGTTSSINNPYNNANRQIKYIVEHMEEDLFDWCEMEYKHMIQQVGDKNLILSHLHPSLLPNIPPTIKEHAVCVSESVEHLGIPKERVVLLDPSSTTPLSPQDAELFDYALFGGILGDDPPKDRTKELRVKGFPTRHLGPVQMTSDTAVLVTKMVLEGGNTLEAITYADRPEIFLSKKESVTMPFRYVRREDGSVVFAPGLLDLIKADQDKSLDDLIAELQ